MGEEDGQTDKPEAAANINARLEEKSEVVTEKKEESNAVTEMEEDKKDDGKDEAHNMDVDEVQNKESKEADEKEAENGIGEKEEKEETKDEKEKKETKGDGDKQEAKREEEKEEIKSEGMEDEFGKKPDDEAEDKVEADVDEVKAEEEPEDHKEGKGSKKRPRTKSRSGQKDRSKKRKAEKEEPEAPIEKKAKQPKTTTKKKEEESKTTTLYAIERPVRERKSVERLVATIEKDYDKDFQIEKGHGTALKDIPNVAYKLSRRKTDDTFKLLHTILFGRRGKAAQVKNNISKFSGFVWPDNEEKQMIKVKEKLDKCVKEKLVEFCDVLDLQIPKANTRKEDIVAKLIEFLMAPHATTTELLAEKEQSSKGEKRKRDGKRSEPAAGSTLSKGSAESQKRTGSASKNGEENESIPESDDESDKEKEEMHEEQHVDGVIEKSEEEISEHAESQEKESKSEDESVKDRGKQRRSSTKSSAKESTEKGKTKKVSVTKNASPPPKKAPAKSPSRTKYNNDTRAKNSSGKKKAEALEEKATPKKSASKESTGKKVVKGKDTPKEDKLKPSDNELKSATCEILKEVDFNTSTFTDILKLLAKRFSTDLTSRKSSIKLMIQEELTKLADESDDDEGEGNAKKDGKQPAG